MKIILKNAELAAAINFLQGMSLKASDSRHRSKFVKLLVKPYESLVEEEQTLAKEYAYVDSEVAPTKDQKNLFKQEQAKLFNEEVVIEGGVFAKNIEELPRILEEFDGELSGNDAEIYDRLLDEFEKADAE